jgi:hypothetical protein
LALAAVERKCLACCSATVSSALGTGPVLMGALGTLYKARVSAIALVNVWYHPEMPLEKDFRAFLLDRGRMWKLSLSPLNVALAVPGMEAFETSMSLTPVFSGGVDNWTDNVFPVCQNVILNWMQEVAEDPDYRNPEFEIFVLEEEEEADAAVEEEVGRVEEAEPKPEYKPRGRAKAEN